MAIEEINAALDAAITSFKASLADLEKLRDELRRQKQKQEGDG